MRKGKFLFPLPETAYKYDTTDLFKWVEAYPSCHPGLILNKSLDGVGWKVTHRGTGLRIMGVRTLKLAALCAGVLSAVEGWELEKRAEVIARTQPQLEQMDLKGWIRSMRED